MTCCKEAKDEGIQKGTSCGGSPISHVTYHSQIENCILLLMEHNSHWLGYFRLLAALSTLPYN